MLANENRDDFLPEDVPLPALAGTASGLTWRLKPVNWRDALAIKQSCNFDYIIARLLAARGIDAAAVEDYLSPTLRSEMPDPSVLEDMDKAASRIADAVIAGETIAVFGDYDVDGTTSAALLHQYFAALGTTILVHLPDRIAEGYGPSHEAFANLRADGADLIITVDCGAGAHDVIAESARNGANIIVFDHHQMDGPPPEAAIATVNPNRLDDLSGLGNLSAAGVVFLALVAINRELRARNFFSDTCAEPDLRGFLDLAALGLVCDVMPMRGLTRVLVKQGLRIIDSGAGNAGLIELGSVVGVKGPASTYHLGFLLGPRINAAGRIGHASKAFKLLTTEDHVERKRIASDLHAMNAARQEIEARTIEEAIAQIESHQRQSDPVIVAAKDDWHPGIIGIVAGRLKERYGAPTIVIGVEAEIGKGSGRSISGVDLGSAISHARREGLLLAGGGHAMAAGLTIDTARIDEFRRYLFDQLRDDVEKAKREARIEIDVLVRPDAVTGQFADLVAGLGPFGPGNPEPVFALSDLRVASCRTVGSGHLSVSLAGSADVKINAIAFRAADSPVEELLKSGRSLAVCGRIRRDDWRGGNAAQLQISDVGLLS